jgi:hypothetical protein
MLLTGRASASESDCGAPGSILMNLRMSLSSLRNRYTPTDEEAWLVARRCGLPKVSLHVGFRIRMMHAREALDVSALTVTGCVDGDGAGGRLSSSLRKSSRADEWVATCPQPQGEAQSPPPRERCLARQCASRPVRDRPHRFVGDCPRSSTFILSEFRRRVCTIFSSEVVSTLARVQRSAF